MGPVWPPGSVMRTKALLWSSLAATICMVSCSAHEGSNSALSTTAIPAKLDGQSDVSHGATPMSPVACSSSPPGAATSGTISSFFSNGFTLNQGAPHGLIHICDTGAVIVAPTPLQLNQSVNVSGAGSVSTSITAACIYDSTHTCSTPSPQPTPTPPPGATLIFQGGDAVSYPDTSSGQFTNPSTFTNVWGGTGYHFDLVRTDSASPCSVSPSCPERQMANVGTGPTELLWGHHYQVQFQTLNGFKENGSFGITLLMQLHPYGNGNEISNMSVKSVDCSGGSTNYGFQDNTNNNNPPSSVPCSPAYQYGQTDTWVYDFTLPSCPADTGGQDKWSLNGSVVIGPLAGATMQCDSTAGPTVGFGIYEYRWVSGGGSTDMEEKVDFNFLKMFAF